MNCFGQYNLSFGANLVSKPTILRNDKDTDKYNDTSASFVEINPMNSNDRDAVWDAVEGWDKDSYGVNVANCMESIAEKEIENPADRIYAITTQKNNYEKLDPEKIEALAHVFETNKRIRLMYLQVNPELVYYLENPKLKHVGTGMINGLKDKYNDHSIILNPSLKAIGFYKKLGFEECSDGDMIWNKEAETDSEYKGEYW